MQEERELLAREKAEKQAEEMRQQKAIDGRRLQRKKKGNLNTDTGDIKNCRFNILLRLRKGVRSLGRLDAAHEDPHRQEALQLYVSRLQQKIRAQ